MKYIQICILLLCCIACEKEEISVNDTLPQTCIGTHQGELYVQNKGVSNDGTVIESAPAVYYHTLSIQQGTRESSILLHQNNTTTVLKYIDKNRYEGVFLSKEKDCSTIEKYQLYWMEESKTLHLEYVLESVCKQGEMKQKGNWEVTLKS